MSTIEISMTPHRAAAAAAGGGADAAELAQPGMDEATA